MRNSGKALLGLVPQQEGAKRSNRWPCSLPGGASWSLKLGEGGVGPGVRPEGGLGYSTHPLGGAVCRGHARDPAFVPGSSEVAVGFWSFCILFIICRNCTCTQFLLVPYSFFVSVCPGASTAAKGPRSWVPVCLSINSWLLKKRRDCDLGQSIFPGQ